MYAYKTDTKKVNIQSASSGTAAAIKWPEVFSLGALNAAVAISWIAYQEYQPVLLQKFQVAHLSMFLVLTKALVLVLIPVISGWAADKILASKGKYFIVYMVGISTAAMIFMIVASMISLGPNNAFASFLPVMIVLWLVSMSIFLSPANSMIESFASNKNLPIVMGVIILITDIIYALEPIVVMLVRFFGDTLTFVVGGILVLGTGLLFNKLTSDEVFERKQSALHAREISNKSSAILPILLVGLLLGIGRAFLVEFIPVNSPVTFITGAQLSFAVLGCSALIAFAFSGFVSRKGTNRILPISFVIMALGIVLLTVASSSTFLFLAGSAVLAFSFGMAQVSGLPFAFSRLSIRQITFGIGVFLGASALAEGIFEIYYLTN